MFLFSPGDNGFYPEWTAPVNALRFRCGWSSMLLYGIRAAIIDSLLALTVHLWCHTNTKCLLGHYTHLQMFCHIKVPTNQSTVSRRISTNESAPLCFYPSSANLCREPLCDNLETNMRKLRDLADTRTRSVKKRGFWLIILLIFTIQERWLKIYLKLGRLPWRNCRQSNLI